MPKTKYGATLTKFFRMIKMTLCKTENAAISTKANTEVNEQSQMQDSARLPNKCQLCPQQEWIFHSHLSYVCSWQMLPYQSDLSNLNPNDSYNSTVVGQALKNITNLICVRCEPC